MEYVPLTSTSLTEHDVDDGDFDSLEPGSKLPHRFNGYTNTENRISLVWLTILIAITAVSAAASLHISILASTSFQPIRSPSEITSSLRMAVPSPNLEKGRALMAKKNMKSQSR